MDLKPFYEDPSEAQTAEEIEEFLRSRVVGDEVAIRNTQNHSLIFKIAVVTELRSRGRFWTDLGAVYGNNSWFVKSGKNCGAPTGQVTLVIPTSEVRRYIAEKRTKLDMRPINRAELDEWGAKQKAIANCRMRPLV